MSEKQTGFLVIADISGYTKFLQESELEPAAAHLRGLLDLLILHTRPPLKISRLEGDAVISYALDGSIQRGQLLIDVVEETYIAFRQAIELAVLNNSCDCNACSNVGELDLKFFVHYGPFIIQPLGTYNELVGNEVNLIHRLTKNTIHERTGIQAYVAYTETAAEKLGIRARDRNMVQHEESYEDVGRVSIYIQDMNQLWQQLQSRSNQPVNEEDTLIRVEKKLPIFPASIWDYLTKPEYKALLLGSQDNVGNRTKRSIGAGAVYQCDYGGKATSPHLIVAWEPFQQYTIESKRLFGTQGRTTVRISPSAHGSKISILVGKSEAGTFLARKVTDIVYRFAGRRQLTSGIDLFYDQVSEEARGNLKN